MGSSGLIYAAIVAGWAAFLVPRWVRRNEEVDQAREADQARGVRVLGPPASMSRGARAHARHEPPVAVIDEPPAAADEPDHIDEHRQGARRRRRVLTVLILALIAVTVVAVIGTLALWSVAIPALMIAGFLQLARRAAAAEAKRGVETRRRLGRADGHDVPRQPREAVLAETEQALPVDPHAWEPVPVPLPTYLTKDKAPDTSNRTIDLAQPGAWTSTRLESVAPITPPPRPVPGPEPLDKDVEELPEHRPAVGD